MGGYSIPNNREKEGEFMNIKHFFEKMIPSYRMGMSILKEIQMQAQMQAQMQFKKQLQDLNDKNDYLFWLLQNNNNKNMQDTKKSVFLNMPKAKNQLREIQLAENYILRYLKKKCDELEIHFFLMGGTALGAVRHHGFIPWDDDIDIGMMREDVCVLEKALEKDDIINMRRYYGCWGNSMIKVKFNCSDDFYVDIFPFDFIRATEENIGKRWDETQKLTENFINSSTTYIKENYIEELDFSRPQFEKRMNEYLEDKYLELIKDCDYYGGNEGNYITESIQNGTYRKSRGFWKYSDEFPLLINVAEFEGKPYDMLKNYSRRLDVFFGDIWDLPNCISVKHNEEFSTNLQIELEKIKKSGIDIHGEGEN